MNQKAVRVILYIVLLLCLQLTKGSLVNFMEKHYGVGRIEVYLKETMNFSEIYLRDSYETMMPALMGSKYYTIGAKDSVGKVKEIEVEGIGTNSYFEEMTSFELQEGAYFGEGAVKEGRPVVIISDTLAKALFSSEQVIGSSCEIDGSTYQIVGVYTRYKHLKDALFDTGLEKVYFPITSMAGKELKVSGILLPSIQGEMAMDEKALSTLGVNENNSYIYHGEDAIKRLQSLEQVIINIGGIIILINVIMYGMYLGKCKELAFRKKGCHLIVAVGIGGVALIMLMKSIYIPKEMLPPYNIFDMTYYWEYYKSKLMLHNQLARVRLTDFEGLYWLMSKWFWGINLMQVVLEIKICRDVQCKMRKGRLKKY